MHSIAPLVREVSTYIGLHPVNLLPPLRPDWSSRDGTIRNGQSVMLVQQGINTCAQDVVIFFGWALQLGCQQRDMEPLGTWQSLSAPATMYRKIMARIWRIDVDQEAKNKL